MVDHEDDNENNDLFGLEEPHYDDEFSGESDWLEESQDPAIIDATVEGDAKAHTLVIHKVLTTPWALESDLWLHRSIFHTTCMLGGRQCTIISDNECTENLLS